MMRLLFLLFIILHFQHCLPEKCYYIDCNGLKAAVIEKSFGKFALMFYCIQLDTGNSLDLKDVTKENGNISFKFQHSADEAKNTLQTWPILSEVDI